jgi:hypothetical protein
MLQTQNTRMPRYRRPRPTRFGVALNIRMSRDLLDKIDEIAADAGLPMSEWARDVLAAEVAKIERQHGKDQKSG